jgi:hypothetical protein
MMKGQKSLEMIIGLVILLVVAGVVISTFLSQFQDNPGSQYEGTLEQEEISRTCQQHCAEYKNSQGIKAQTNAIEYCTDTFVYDANGDGTISGTAGRLYNSYCEDGVKCFNQHTCEVGRTTLDAERCTEIMYEYYTSSQIQNRNPNQSIKDFYKPDGDGDRTVGTCQGVTQGTTWYTSQVDSRPTNGPINY